MSQEVKRYYVGPRTAEILAGQPASEPPADFISLVLASDYDALLAERDAAQKDAERARILVKELDLLFGRYLLAMKAAVIDADQRGDKEGMRWIYNSLAGPGELPPKDETNAQAYFDREIKTVNDGMAGVMTYYRNELAALQGDQQ